MPALNYVQRLWFADTFVVLDIVQRQGRGWENRNKLLLPDPAWLTVPVLSSSRELIVDTLVSENDWVDDHIKRVRMYYQRHPYFSESLLNQVYGGLFENGSSFCSVILRFLRNVCDILGFLPNFILASEVADQRVYDASGPEKLLELCRKVGADIYISGANGRGYGVNEIFEGSNIEVVYHETLLGEYSQPKRSVFEPFMGVLDAMFCMGIDGLGEMIRKYPDDIGEK